VLPGLTGLAQINGRNATTWEARFAHDVAYASCITFWGDVRIIFQTVLSVCKRSGIGVRGVDSPMDFDEYRRRQIEEGSSSK